MELTSVTDQTDIEIPTLDDIDAIADNMLSGIRMCLKRISGDDLFTRRLENLPDELALIKHYFIQILNKQDDDYNALVDQCEELQTNNGLLSLRVTELTKELENSAAATAHMLETERAAHHRKRTELERELTQATDGAESLLSTVKTLEAEKRILSGKLEDLNRMEPHKLKKKNAELKIANAELTKSKTELNATNILLQKRYTRLQLDLAHSESCAAIAAADIGDKDRHDRLIHGETLDQLFMRSPVRSHILFYPYVYKWGLASYEEDARHEPVRKHPEHLMFIFGLDFHIQIRCSLGVELTCKLTEFGRAIYLMPDELKEHWPAEMDAVIQEYHLEQLERLSKPLYDRAIWCREQHINTLDFVPEKLRDGFIAMGIDNLMMLGGITWQEVKSIKGLGEVTLGKIRQGAIAMLETYQHESGPISLVCDAPHTKPPYAQRVQDGIQRCLMDIRDRMKNYGLEDDNAAA